MHRDKRGLNQLLLHLLVKALIQSVAPGLVRRLGQLHTDGLGGGDRLLIRVDGHKVDAAILLHCLVHGHTRPTRSQVDILPMPLHLIGPQQPLGGGRQQVLKKVHHIVKISIGLIQLNGGEFRVVLRVHALVAEDATDLVYPVHAAHNEALQGQLRGDAHIHIDIQGVMVGYKRPGGSTAGNGVQHRRFDLDISPAVHKVPHMLDELRPDEEVFLHIRVHHQVHIALAVAELLVLEAVEFLRQGQQGLGEQGDVLGPDAHLPPLGAENLAVHAHDVSNVKFLELLVNRLVHLVLAGVQLDAAVLVLQITEADLAHAPLAHEAPRHLHGPALHGVKVFLDLPGRGVPVEPGQLKGVLSGGLELRQLLPADPSLFAQVQLGLLHLFSHALSPYMTAAYRSIFSTL